MAEKATRPSPPDSLGEAGAALWEAILSDLDPSWELDAREREFLARACRTTDELAQLEEELDRVGLTVEGSRGQVVVNPALSEARQLRLVQLRLWGRSKPSTPKRRLDSATPAQAQGRKAAQARWGHRAVGRG